LIKEYRTSPVLSTQKNDKKNAGRYPVSIQTWRFYRHCERSEAIHMRHLYGLPRRSAPRNDGNSVSLNRHILKMKSCFVVAKQLFASDWQ
jgi:hypothetical protein